MRKYYSVVFSPKSHSDYPSPQFTSYFSARNPREYDRELKNIIAGCEDWKVREIGKKHYQSVIV